MLQALPKYVTFEEFTQWKPEGGRYELHDGIIIEMSQPTGGHEDIVGFLALEISVDIIGQYEAIGIPEYWIVDYAGLGGKRFLGNPKQPTISIYSLVEGEYQVNEFRGDKRIVSPIFPELSLTANQIFQVSS